MTEPNITNRASLTCELVTVHHLEQALSSPIRVVNDFRYYNEPNGVSSGLTTLKVTEDDVGKTVLDYLSEILPVMTELVNYHRATLYSLPQSKADYDWDKVTPDE